MDILEAQERKDELVKAIQREISKFEEETGLRVRTLRMHTEYLNWHRSGEGGDHFSPVRREIVVRLEGEPE